MMKACLILILYFGLATPSPAQADTMKWRGQCTRPNKPTANAALVLTTRFGGTSGTLNGRQLTALHFDMQAAKIQFDTPGIYQDQAIIRHFNGIFDNEGHLSATLSQDQGEKAASCELELIEGHQ